MIKKLLSSVGEYKKQCNITPFYVTVEAVFDIGIPTLMAYLIDYGINRGNMSNVIWLGLALLLCALLALWMGLLAGRSTAIAAAGFAKNLRLDIFRNVQKFSFSNIDKFSTASIV